MKIFNWVHRRFHHKDGLSENSKKTTAALASAVDEKQYLLQNDGLSSNVFGSWKGGLLTIGTFGYDPLSKVDDDRDVNYEEPDKENLISALQETDTINDYGNYYETSDSEEVQEVNPLMYAAYVHDYQGLMEEMKGNDGGVVVNSAASGECEKDDEEYLDEYMAAMMNMKMKSSSKRERTTLAELFSADSDDYYSDEIIKMQKKQAQEEMAMKQKASGGKNGKLSFAKKIIGDQDARPAIHKLNRLMRRMLKRKIHPSDMEGVNVAHPADHHINNNNDNNSEIVHDDTNRQG